MAARFEGETVRWLEALHRDGSLAGLGDRTLLERFLGGADGSGELAFEVLVRRHGPMVFSTCRGVLRDEQGAEDAFQATFLILARRASAIRDRDRLAPWLGRVARRIALRSRAEAARRGRVERLVPVDAADEATNPAEVGQEAALVAAEIDRLPEADRQVLRLTYWQGRTYEEAATLLSWPIGTVRSRLSRARDRLKGRLTRLGLAPGVGLADLRPPAEALVLRTLRAASRAVELSAAVEAGMVPASVAALVDGELAMMATTPWKTLAALLLAGGAATAGMATLAIRNGESPTRPEVAQTPETPKAKPAPAAKADRKSILENGGIEDEKEGKPEGWAEGAEVDGVEYLWTRDAGHEGKSSLRIKKTARRYFPIAQWTQEVERRGELPRLKVSAWVKTDKATKGLLDVQFLDAKGKWSHAWAAYVGPKETGKPPVTHDWKLHEGVVAIPPGTKRMHVGAQVYGPGTYWFDDVAAEYTDEPATDPISP